MHPLPSSSPRDIEMPACVAIGFRYGDPDLIISDSDVIIQPLPGGSPQWRSNRKYAEAGPTKSLKEQKVAVAEKARKAAVVKAQASGARIKTTKAQHIVTNSNKKLRITSKHLIIRKLSSSLERTWQFGKRAADSFHATIVNKNKKIADRKQQEQKESAQKHMKDVWMGVAPNNQMKRVGAAQSADCNTNIPFLFESVQQHLKSNEHINSKKNYHNLALVNNPTLKAKFDMFLKGENPFGNPQEQ
ncbi:hypothetical protein scyTo_0011512 [Scyliorhinus torazame]|uniref:Uncharacterized protein n=1 Tax=Scyliorhinus torazame TaxID=75743 RepID=A0A401NPI2_SCYTO|nr:hypothetical protein [Scyliorhinus torazame]